MSQKACERMNLMKLVALSVIGIFCASVLRCRKPLIISVLFIVFGFVNLLSKSQSQYLSYKKCIPLILSFSYILLIIN